ncbi:MAG: hypothetical protein K0Q59_2097 [Paenibacillus sp.]|nr:hypothetical protein [Paenibacillus sp.]
MQSDFAHASHLAQLGLLEQLLNETGIATHMLEKSEQLPLHVLLAAMAKDDQGRDRYLHFSFLPVDEEQMSAIQLLQMYCKLPFPLREEARAATADILLDINGKLPIGHFGVDEAGELYFRYVYVMPAKRSFDREEMVELITLYANMYDLFAEQVEAAQRAAD